MSGAQVAIDMVLCRGGLDQITPTLSLPNTYVRNSLNFECSPTGGYTRVAGYERFNGGRSPTTRSNTDTLQFFTLSGIANPITLGDMIANNTGSHSKRGYLVYMDGLFIGVSTGGVPFNAGDPVVNYTTGLSVGTVASLGSSPLNPEQTAIIKSQIANLYRALIDVVPGSGPVRGVFEFYDKVYAFRDDAADPPTSCDLWEGNGAGWVQITYFEEVSFTGGLVEPLDFTTLTQTGVTATIQRVVRTGGSWQNGDAVGYLIIGGRAGGNFTGATATITGGTAVILSGAQSAVSVPPGGTYEFDEHNFGGQADTAKIYGCNGVGSAFEFNGVVLVPIRTGAAVDTPTHIMAHKGFLFLSLGSSIVHSAPGLPYDWTALSGASEIATGGDITAMISMPGGTNQATLGVFSRINTGILYGNSPADWNFVSYNTGTGAMPNSAQNMAQTFVFDDRGVNSVQTALQYGNFNQTTLTNAILPFITERINLLTATTLCRRKSQYRLFFSDGFGLYITVVNGKLSGCMPIYFPNVVTCAYEGKNSAGADVIYFGSDNGMVYQMEKGTSFDGEVIDYNLSMNFSNAKSPRTLKRYRKCVPELSAPAGTFAKFNFSYVLGYDSEEYPQAGATSYDRYVGISRWDLFTWDNFFWDTKGINFIECEVEGTAENIAILIEGSSDYVPEFTINSFLTHYSPRRMMR